MRPRQERRLPGLSCGNLGTVLWKKPRSFRSFRLRQHQTYGRSRANTSIPRMTSDTAPGVQHRQGLHPTPTVAATPHIHPAHEFHPPEVAPRNKPLKNGTSGEPQENLKRCYEVGEGDTGQDGSVGGANGNRDSNSSPIDPIVPLQQTSSTASSENSWLSMADEPRQLPTSEPTKAMTNSGILGHLLLKLTRFLSSRLLD